MTHVSYTNIGKRAINQDHYYPIDDTLQSNLFIVCDGVASSPFGEVASKQICEAAPRFFSQNHESSSDINFDSLAIYLRESLAKMESIHPEIKGMSSTIVLLYFASDGASIAWMGDSRLYHIRDGKILYMTEDHSLANDLKQKGLLEENQTPSRNFIVRSMNTRTKDSFSIQLIPVSNLHEGDFFLLCTDGVLENITNQNLTELMVSGSSISNIADEIKLQCMGKTSDNYTFQLIQI